MESSIHNELNLDSITVLSLLLRTESHYGIQLEEEQLIQMKTVGELVNFVEREVNKKGQTEPH